MDEKMIALKEAVKNTGTLRTAEKKQFKLSIKEAFTEEEHYKVSFTQRALFYSRVRARHLHVLYALKKGIPYKSIERDCREYIDAKMLASLAEKFGIEVPVCDLYE